MMFSSMIPDKKNELNATLCVPRRQGNPHGPHALVVRSSKPSWIPINHVLIRVDQFGFSANNITYQALGDHPHFRYFDFHPPPEASSPQCSPKTHGITPVWGFGTVINSTHPKIRNGERIYGYLAPAKYLLLPVSPSDVNKYAFYIQRPHLPADRRPYNQILRCEVDPQYSPSSAIEDLIVLYRPLFWTSYWCEDWLHASDYRGKSSVVMISSASAKTAFCLAYRIRKRIQRKEIDAATRIVGLTSLKNLTFVKKLCLYHEVLDYATFATNPLFQQANREQKWIYVDVAGNNELNIRINSYFSSPYTPSLAAYVQLGLTNLIPTSNDAASQDCSKNTFDILASTDPNAISSSFWPKVEQFFTPKWLDIRRFEIPAQEILEKQNEAWKDLMEDCQDWVELTRVNGPDDARNEYERVLQDGFAPDKAFVWSLWEADEAVPVSEPATFRAKL